MALAPDNEVWTLVIRVKDVTAGVLAGHAIQRATTLFNWYSSLLAAVGP